MADNESLFSLEVVVESLENVAVSCRVPAIAFRLLDFPTLLIRANEKRFNEISDSSLVNIHGSYSVHSGKSCLFKMNKDTLHSDLETTPLYIMLVDLSANKTKLLASTTISLTNCFENVLRSVEMIGIDIPAVDGKKGVFELYNLMGTPVAVVKLSYRIFSLGGMINGHVKCNGRGTKAPHDLSQKLEVGKKETKILEYNHGVTVQSAEDLVPQDLGNANKMERTLEHLQLDVQTQTDVAGNEEIILKARKENVNITRPPPLYYNSQSMSVDCQHSLVSKNISSERNTHLSNVEVNKNKTVGKSYQTISVQTDKQVYAEDDVNNTCTSKLRPERQQLVDLPLINALLTELQLVKQSVVNTAQQLEYHDTNNRGTQTSGVKSKDKFFQPSNKSTTQVTEIIHKPEVLKTNAKGVLLQRPEVKFKKTPLKCRTTKTQKLREAFNKSRKCPNIPVPSKIIQKKSLLNDDGIANMKAKFVGRKICKETQGFACQVDTCHENEDRLIINHSGRKTEAGHTESERKCKEIGVEAFCSGNTPVQHSSIHLFNRKDLLPSSDNIYSHVSSDREPNHLSQGAVSVDLGQEKTKILNSTLVECQDHISPDSTSQSSGHSRKSVSSIILQEPVKPVFSNFSPTPATKNARYMNGVHDSGSEEPRFFVDDSSGSKGGLVGKPIGHFSSVSSLDRNYSDNFDSFASEQTTESN